MIFPINLQIPSGFSVTEKGIFKGDEEICDSPILVTRQVVDAKTSYWHLELALFSHWDKDWHFLIYPCSALNSYSSAQKLMKWGHFVYNVRQTSIFLMRLQKQNRELIPIVVARNIPVGVYMNSQPLLEIVEDADD